jgi:hypothetical protein
MNKCHLYVEDVLITGGEYIKSPQITEGKKWGGFIQSVTIVDFIIDKPSSYTKP